MRAHGTGTLRIADARVVTPGGVVEGDVLYEEGAPGRAGKVLEVGSVSAGAAPTWDAGGAWVVPGGIDPHVHFGGFGDIPIADDFYRGSRAALAGGTTTVIDFVEPQGDETAAEALARRMADASTSAVDYAYRFVLTERYREQLAELALVEGAGIRDYKLFTVYEGETLSPADIGEVFDALAADPGRTFLIHAEDPAVIGPLRAERGDTADFSDLSRTRPPEAETRMTARLRDLAEEKGARVCIAHSTCAGTVALEDRPVSRGEFVLETCPHYLAFGEEELSGPSGALYTMTPPLRDAGNRAALMAGVLDGRVAMLSTDHCPYARRHKLGSTYQTVPCGVDGVGTRMPWAFGELVGRRGMSPERFCELTSGAAARFYGLYPRKGAIAPGSDADLAVLRDGSAPVRVEEMTDGLDYSVWEGRDLGARVVRTVRGGRLAWDGSHVLARPGSGAFLAKRPQANMT